MSFKLSSEPGSEPLSLTEVKAHLRLTAPGGESAYTSEDTYLNTLIKVARRYSEFYTSRSFINQTWKYYADEFPATIELLYGPVSSITSIQYVDSDGASQTLDPADYVTDLTGHIPRITAVEEWPETDETLNAVTVTYVAGFGASASNVPEDIKAAMLLIVGKMYQDREETVKKLPSNVDWLLNSYKVYHAL
jgi:uncharacterized phiE125 gp8 family phage protein